MTRRRVVSGWLAKRGTLGRFADPPGEELAWWFLTVVVCPVPVVHVQATRKSFTRIINGLPQPPAFLPFLPKAGDAPVPVLLPTAAGTPAPAVVAPNKLLEVTVNRGLPC